MEHVKAPTSPRAQNIHGIDGIQDACATGKGQFHVRSSAKSLMMKGKHCRS